MTEGQPIEIIDTTIPVYMAEDANSTLVRSERYVKALAGYGPNAIVVYDATNSIYHGTGKQIREALTRADTQARIAVRAPFNEHTTVNAVTSELPINRKQLELVLRFGTSGSQADNWPQPNRQLRLFGDKIGSCKKPGGGETVSPPHFGIVNLVVDHANARRVDLDAVRESGADALIVLAESEEYEPGVLQVIEELKKQARAKGVKIGLDSFNRQLAQEVVDRNLADIVYATVGSQGGKTSVWNVLKQATTNGRTTVIDWEDAAGKTSALSVARNAVSETWVGR